MKQDFRFRTAYRHGARVGDTVPEGESLTKQAFKDECDINRIVRRFIKTGQIPRGRPGAAFGDFTGVGDFQAMQNKVLAARVAFMQLPAAVRARFGNDPAQLIEFLGDKANQAEAVRLGLAEKPEVVPDVPKVEKSAPGGSESVPGAVPEKGSHP